LEVGPTRSSALLEGPAKRTAGKRRVKKEYRVKSKIENQNVKRKDTEQNAKGKNTRQKVKNGGLLLLKIGLRGCKLPAVNMRATPGILGWLFVVGCS